MIYQYILDIEREREIYLVYLFIYIYICVYVCICIYIYICICINTNGIMGVATLAAFAGRLARHAPQSSCNGAAVCGCCGTCRGGPGVEVHLCPYDLLDTMEM